VDWPTDEEASEEGRGEEERPRPPAPSGERVTIDQPAPLSRGRRPMTEPEDVALAPASGKAPPATDALNGAPPPRPLNSVSLVRSAKPPPGEEGWCTGRKGASPKPVGAATAPAAVAKPEPASVSMSAAAPRAAAAARSAMRRGIENSLRTRVSGVRATQEPSTLQTRKITGTGTA